jgi:transcriptional regulator with XRE-family HTH domain
MITFGENILLWRLHRGLSQEELAALSGIPRPNLSDIEKGKRDVTLTTIRSLSYALGVSVGTLTNGEPPEGDRQKIKLSRERIERIAYSVAHGKAPDDPAERKLYQLLKGILNCSLKSARARNRRLPLPSRKGNLSWLQLRSLYSSEIIRSLIEKSLEKAEGA